MRYEEVCQIYAVARLEDAVQGWRLLFVSLRGILIDGVVASAALAMAVVSHEGHVQKLFQALLEVKRVPYRIILGDSCYSDFFGPFHFYRYVMTPSFQSAGRNREMSHYFKGATG